MTDPIEEALAELEAGRLIVVPTDTVYGVAALPTSPGAVEALFRAKGRPREKAIPILGSDIASMERVARFDDRARRLAEQFWPGGLTIVLPRAAGFDTDLGGEDPGTVAVRVPNSALTRALLERSGPLAVTSANASGETPAMDVAEARAVLGDAVNVFLDEGPGGGQPSTVISLVSEPEVLRVGALDAAEVRAALGSG